MFTTHSLSTVQQHLRDISSEGNAHLHPIVMTTFMGTKMSNLVRHIFSYLDLQANLRHLPDTEPLIDMHGMCLTQTVQVFSSLVGLANHPSVNLSLEEEVRAHFPGVCPYCGNGTCICNPRPKKRKSKDFLRSLERGLEGDVNLQLMLSNIYLENKLPRSILHLNCECFEVSWVIASLTVQYSSTHLIRSPSEHSEKGRFATSKLRMEIADMMARLFAIANLLQFDLLEAAMTMFKNGCPLCSGKTCSCNLLELEMDKVC